MQVWIINVAWSFKGTLGEYSVGGVYPTELEATRAAGIVHNHTRGEDWYPFVKITNHWLSISAVPPTRL